MSDLLPAWPDCPECGGTGIEVMVDLEYAAETRPCACRWPENPINQANEVDR